MSDLLSLSIESSIPLLASVRNLDEAQSVWSLGVSILDFKDPSSGSLGKASSQLLEQFLNWRATVEQTGSTSGLPRLSFSAGELSQAATRLMEQYPRSVLRQFDFAKLGLAGCCSMPWKSRWDEYFATPSIEPVMVGYVDHQTCDAPSVNECLRHAAEHPRCRTLLIDTYGKQKRLFDWVSPDWLQKLVAGANRQGVRVVVAGSVTLANLSDVVRARPFAVGVRGAICREDRQSEVCAQKTRELIQRLRIESLGSIKPE